MTRKHFRAIAAALKAGRASDVIINTMAQTLQNYNENFNSALFKRECEWNV